MSEAGKARAERVKASTNGRHNGQYSTGPTTATVVDPESDALWPKPMAEAAFHGPLGALVKVQAPYTEASREALLAHGIVITAGYLGPEAHGFAGDIDHPVRFYAGVVGVSSKGRKGTSAAPFRRVMGNTSDKVRITKGLSSSEGLIHQVRDHVEKWNAKEQRFDVVDPGVSDKRLVVIEGEFASLLRRMEREGNAISATMREAWDTGDLETLVKVNPSRATGAHICVIAHITVDELRQYLQPTEITSGFANRILWFAIKRTQLIPRGVRTPEVVAAITTFGEALTRARGWVREQGNDTLIGWSEAAGKAWDLGYEQLSRDRPGMFGAATQRAEAQVYRLAVLYAVLDCSAVIEPVHLQAALAVWDYCEASAKWIFADRTGNPIADAILQGLRANGELSRTQISGLLNNNRRADQIAVALALLLRLQLARTEMRGSGRDQTEWWIAC